MYGLVSVFVFAEEASINRIYTYPELLPFLKRDSISEESTPPFSSFLQINAESILPKDLWRDTERKTVLKKIEAYGNRSIAGDLSLVLLEYGQIAEFKKIYLLFSSGKTKTQPADISLMPHKLLPAIVVAKWILETNKTNSLAPAKILNDLVAFLNDSRDAFKADSSRLLQPFLLTELVLDKTESTPP